jgi:hypothetical protein
VCKSYAQEYKRLKEDFEPFSRFSVKAGPAGYYGDLNSYQSFEQLKNTRYTVGLAYDRALSSKVALGFNASMLQISGNDFYANTLREFTRNLHFSNNIFELGARLRYDFLNKTANYKERPDWTYFLTSGFSLAYSNPTTKLAGIPGKINLSDYNTEGQGFAAAYGDPYSKLIYMLK